jgi:hypothetical protein
MEDEPFLPRVDEPMEEYLKSDRYRQSSASITFSDFEGQEEANYAYWRHLTPSQRLELHTIMVSSVYRKNDSDPNNEQVLELIFTT